MGAALGCLSVTLTVAACLSYRSPFAISQDQQDAAGRARQALSAPGMQQSQHPQPQPKLEGPLLLGLQSPCSLCMIPSDILPVSTADMFCP